MQVKHSFNTRAGVPGFRAVNITHGHWVPCNGHFQRVSLLSTKTNRQKRHVDERAQR